MMKVCVKCKEKKPLTNEFFHSRKGSKDGFRNDCKVCHSKRTKAYYDKNKEVIIKQNTDYRKANWESFTKARKSYEERNKEVLAEKRREYNQRNKDIVAKRKQEQYLKNKVRYAKYHLEYARKHPDKCKLKRHKREAKIKNLPSTLTVEQWEITKKHFNNVCAYCGGENFIQQEHFIPVAKGGEYSFSNILPSCRSCNCSKQDKDFFEWYPKQPYYSKQREDKILKFLALNNKCLADLTPK